MIEIGDNLSDVLIMAIIGVSICVINWQIKRDKED